MSQNIRNLVRLLEEPRGFFNSVRDEDWKPAFIFFSQVTTIISVITPFLNYLGMESTDTSSSYQAQIVAHRFVKNSLISLYGTSAYLMEAVIIFLLSVLFLVFLTVFIHVIYKIIGGTGPVLNSWKSACYGVGPCLLGGFLPYIALFSAFWSFALQLYLGPLFLYEVKEGRAIFIFVSLIALTFIEMFVTGTTVGF